MNKRSLSLAGVRVLAVLVFSTAPGFAAEPQPLRFEAEDVTEPRDAWRADQFTADHWNLWSTDQKAGEKWSGGVVLKSPEVKKDRAKPEDGAPPLHTVIDKLAPGKYHLWIAGVSRPMGISLDGREWRRLENPNFGVVEIGSAGFQIWIDDRFASKENPGSCYYDYLEFTPLPDPKRKPPVQGFAEKRVREVLDRGLVALAADGGGNYIGWRLLDSDPEDVVFNLYRRVGDGEPEKLNAEPIAKTTDFVDASAPQAGACQYHVVSVVKGKEGEASKIVRVNGDKKPAGHLSFPIGAESTFQKCGIADLNGDGAYDYVIKLPNANIDPYEKYWKRSTETYTIEAYLSDGTFLWRHDLGWSIERGIWYSPMVVHDLDGDGKAEVCIKGGEGDPRDKDGRVQTGAEFLIVLDGMTGKERCRADWPRRENFPSYNLASRNQLGVAYLDGKTPCLIVERGTYNVIQVQAWELREGKLKSLWKWDEAEEGGGYRGQGAHSMHAVDIDGDGRDEIFLGSAVLDDNGVGLWSTGLGHPDHHYVGDIDPERPGLEVYYGIETRNKENGCCLVDAATGEILWGLDIPTRHVHSTGLCADIDPRHPGVEAYSCDTDKEKKPEVSWLFDAKGQVLEKDLDWDFGLKTVYWDADTQRELIRGRKIFEYKGKDYGEVLSGSSVVAFADVLGDWREELIATAPGEFRIYTTRIPAADRRVCLMQDPLYRLDVCLQAMGYTQCPMTTKCLSWEKKPADAKK